MVTVNMIFRILQRNFVIDQLRQSHLYPKCATFTNSAFNTHSPLHQLQQAFRDIQPQAGAFRDLPIGDQLRERLEYRFQLVGRNSYTTINNFTTEQTAAGLIIAHTHGNTTPAGVLDRVTEQVEQDLAEFAFIPPHVRRQRSEGFIFKTELLLFGLKPGEIEHLAYKSRQVKDDCLDFHLASLDLTHVENVVNQRQQVFAAAAHDAQLVPLAGCQIFVMSQNLGITKDGIQRRAQLMAHAGQEITLGTISAFGRFLGTLQFNDPLSEGAGQIINPLNQVTPLPLKLPRIAAAVQTPLLYRDDQPIRLLKDLADGLAHGRERTGQGTDLIILVDFELTAEISMGYTICHLDDLAQRTGGHTHQKKGRDTACHGENQRQQYAAQYDATLVLVQR